MSQPAEECCICFEEIGKINNCVTECGHTFCFKCMAMSMYHKNACPCCRSKLVDIPEEEESDGEYEESYDEGEDDDEIDDDEGAVEDIMDRLEKNGITMLDVVSMLINRYSKRDITYTDEHITTLNTKFDQLVTDVDNEYTERQLFAAEDNRVAEVI